MLKINGEMYNLRNEMERGQAHEYIDTLYMEEVYSVDGNGKKELKMIHELVSDMDEQALLGKWFEGCIIIEEYFTDIREFLNEMGLLYFVTKDGDIKVHMDDDKTFYLTRFEDKRELFESYGHKVNVYTNGIIEDLKGMNLEIDKVYYLEKGR